jgi:hypothetical protein
VWPVALSGRLPVVALVSHYLTNKLIGRESIPDRKTFHTIRMPVRVISGISSGFPGLSQSLGQVTHVLLTRSPLIQPEQAPIFTVRLACVKHAASVRPEPGSNSPLMLHTQHPPHKPRGRHQAKTTHEGSQSLTEAKQLAKPSHPPQPKKSRSRTTSTGTTPTPATPPRRHIGIDF